jgi:NADP-dependent 3-hydroxy acid dehydrogenase YdfG
MKRVIVITGASAGIGRATARAFAREGADLALIARGMDGLEATRVEIENLGRRALVVAADVAHASAIEEAAERTETELGPIDGLTN